ncbi:MAG TPA: hypothetical protein VMO00_06920 [Methylomirabilota bacterium]|nr:hypothetical protein [Methylomirabilota bacterium]
MEKGLRRLPDGQRRTLGLTFLWRRTRRITVFDTESGKAIANLGSPGDTDDIFYDKSRQRIYISGGDGTVGILQRTTTRQ